jgi:hypothetical protein
MVLPELNVSMVDAVGLLFCNYSGIISLSPWPADGDGQFGLVDVEL